MPDLLVKEGSISDLDSLYPCFERDFPAGERLERNRLELLMAGQRYKLFLAMHPSLPNTRIGYAFIYEPEFPQMVWLDYMAIAGEFQNSGYGTRFFRHLAQQRGWANLGIILEVEPATSADAGVLADQQRRMTFYQRLGAKQLHVDYQFPTLQSALPMHLYFYPAPGVRFISKEDVQAAILSAFNYIHGDKPHRNRIYMSFLHTISELRL